ncbi:MAG: hypothetical protein R3F30_09835 [Planctomycetota bacterium]
MPRTLPLDMLVPPPLVPPPGRPEPTPRHALLLNPFYAKDPHASFGKHVLTPSLALTSIAGATPEGWELRYWDENLLQGSPPVDPLPAVVGITVHLTFARRAYRLADFYRALGCTVVLGGLHLHSCPEEARPRRRARDRRRRRALAADPRRLRRRPAARRNAAAATNGLRRRPAPAGRSSTAARS